MTHHSETDSEEGTGTYRIERGHWVTGVIYNRSELWIFRAQKLCESRDGRPGFPPISNKPTVSVDVRQHSIWTFSFKLPWLYIAMRNPVSSFWRHVRSVVSEKSKGIFPIWKEAQANLCFWGYILRLQNVEGKPHLWTLQQLGIGAIRHQLCLPCSQVRTCQSVQFHSRYSLHNLRSLYSCHKLHSLIQTVQPP